MTNTGKTILIILGVAAAGTAGYFIFRKKKPAAMLPTGTVATEIPSMATNPYVAPADKKKSNTGKIIGIAAGALGAAALTALITGKKNKERKDKGIPVTSTGIDPKFVL